MELGLNIEQLQLKSEYSHTNPRCTHYHEDSESPLLVSWDDCVTVLYPLSGLSEASLWNPIEPMITPINNPIQSVLTYNSKIYCIDKIGNIYYLKQTYRDSPDLFDCSPPAKVSQESKLSYEWISFYSPKFSCNIFGTTCYSDGIAIIVTLGECIVIQLLQINNNEYNEPILISTCSKEIRPQKQFPFLVTHFISCTWKNWFCNQRAKEFFEPNVLDSQDIFIIATDESKIYSSTSNSICKNASLFLNSPQKIVYIQFCDFESKKLLLVSYSGILSIIDCVQNIPSTFIHLAVTKVVAVFIVDLTVIVSNGVHLFLITLDKQFSKIVKQVVTPLKGVLSIHRFQFNNIIAVTQQNKVYKLNPKYEEITQEELKVKLNENDILENIKHLCKCIESIEEQHGKMNKYINALSVVARKDLVAQYCSFNILIYSGAKAVKLGAHQDEYIFAIKISTTCSWLSLPATTWQLLVCVTDSKSTSSNCALHFFNVDVFNINHPLMVKHHISASIAKNCTFGTVYCELVCQLQNEFVNRSLIIPLWPVKLNALYFVKAVKGEKLPMINPLEDQHKYVFKYPENMSLVECLSVIINRNKHRISKSLYTSIIDNTPKILYLNLFGMIISLILEDNISKTIALECTDHNTLIAVRNGILDELSNDQPPIINYSVLADVQKQLCLLEEISVKDQQNENIVKEIKNKIQNHISVHLPV